MKRTSWLNRANKPNKYKYIICHHVTCFGQQLRELLSNNVKTKHTCTSWKGLEFQLGLPIPKSNNSNFN